MTSTSIGTIAKWLRRLIRIAYVINSSLRAQVQILLVSFVVSEYFSLYLFFHWTLSENYVFCNTDDVLLS